MEELVEWKDLWDKGQQDKARKAAVSYVDQNRENLEVKYGDLTQEECVKLVDLYRDAGDEAKELEVKVWIMSEYPPQHIGGAGETVIRRGQKRGK